MKLNAKEVDFNKNTSQSQDFGVLLQSGCCIGGISNPCVQNSDKKDQQQVPKNQNEKMEQEKK